MPDNVKALAQLLDGEQMNLPRVLWIGQKMANAFWNILDLFIVQQLVRLIFCSSYLTKL